ncbi:MAG: hypothetical protein AAB337_03855 [Patescibacteria group bacterium]
MAHSIEIVKGPNKFDLMVSLFHGDGQVVGERQMLDFELRDENGETLTVSVCIWSVEREGMLSIEQWVIKGLTASGKKFPISYNARTRKGYYWPEPEDR